MGGEAHVHHVTKSTSASHNKQASAPDSEPLHEHVVAINVEEMNRERERGVIERGENSLFLYIHQVTVFVELLIPFVVAFPVCYKIKLAKKVTHRELCRVSIFTPGFEHLFTFQAKFCNNLTHFFRR